MLQEIKPDIHSVGANDPGRKLFDALLPLPHGTTYNAYIVKTGGKVVLIDTVDPSKREVLFANLETLGVSKIDYVIANHAEQDHSGSLPILLEKFPEAQILCSDKCVAMLGNLLNVPAEKCRVVHDGEKMTIGEKTFEFIYTPWVHWPETMCTLVQEDAILFSCDFFGSHFGVDDLLAANEEETAESAKSYFAEIMMPFRMMIKNHLTKLAGYKIRMIAPSHGPIHTSTEKILEHYRDWSSDAVKNLVLILYVSMHGSTKGMAEALRGSLEERGVKTEMRDITEMNLNEVAALLVDAATIVVGTPNVLGEIHPSAAHMLFLVNVLKPKTKFVSVLSSYGWSGGVDNGVTSLLKNLNAEVIPTVSTQGLPKEADFEKIRILADEIYKKHKELGVI